jgi:hypothetical protein
MASYKPPTQAAKIAALSEAVDRLSGQVAALMAYIAHTSPPLAPADVIAAQAMARRNCPAKLGAEASPIVVASVTVENLKSMKEKSAALRRAAERPLPVKLDS